MQRYAPFKKLSKTTYLIGVTGHINLNEEERLKDQVRKILLKIKAKNHPEIAILCPGAAGGDQLVANVAMEPEIDIPVIALRLVDYKMWHPGLSEEFKENVAWLEKEKNNTKVRKVFIDDPYYKNELDNLTAEINPDNREQEFQRIKHEMLTRLSAVIAGESDYIIALWDGVDNGKAGGTSETVHMALHAKSFSGQPISLAPEKAHVLDTKAMDDIRKLYKKPKGYLYQVVTPRSYNRFPIGRFPAELIDNIPNAGKYETGLTVFPIIPAEGSRWLRYKRSLEGSWFKASLFWPYYFPALLALVTVLMGGFGFRQAAQLCEERAWWPIGNDFFSAINLITFDASKDLPTNPSILLLELARVIGLLFVLTAFVIAIFIALGKNSKILFKIKMWNRFQLSYQLIMGLNDKSYHLAADLMKNGKRVVIVTGDANELKIAEAAKQGMNVYIGNPYAMVSLIKVRAHKASKVYFMDDDDTLNIRSLNELDQLSSSMRNKKELKKIKKQTRYVHVSDFRYKDFVCISHKSSDYSETQVFNLYENTARRLMRKYPIYRFDLNKPDQTAEVFVFGFGEMAEEIVLHSLRSGFYDQGRKLKITIFTSNHEEKRALFYKKYPVLWYNNEQNPAYERAYTNKIRKEIFPEGTVIFKELPMSDGAYFSDDSLDRAIRSGNVITLYFCTPQSVQSAAYLQAILPKIAQLQRAPDSQAIITDVQCFCHYNLFDHDEVAYAEHVVNERIPNSAVIFFGSFINECTERCFDYLTEDQLPRLINLWYNLDHSKLPDGQRKDAALLLEERKEFWESRTNKAAYREEALADEAKELWKSLSPMVKESNLHAADHIWTKLHLMGSSFSQLHDQLQKQSLTEVATKYLYTDENPIIALILEMAKVEHRRWCAERLLEGFMSFHDFYPDLITTEEFAATVHKWNTGKLPFKSYFQAQKQHLDLLPFDDLFTGRFGQAHYDEKVKDISLIEAIPYLISKAYN